MLERRKTSRTLGEHGIFGDEEAAELRHDLDTLRGEMRDMALRLHAQFTTIAAHAEIAREQIEQARAEARADLERTRDTLIELIETVRTEAGGVRGTHLPGRPPGPSVTAMNERLSAVESAMAQATSTVDRCVRRQNELADTMTAFLDTMLAEPAGQPVAALSLA